MHIDYYSSNTRDGGGGGGGGGGNGNKGVNYQKVILNYQKKNQK